MRETTARRERILDDTWRLVVVARDRGGHQRRGRARPNRRPRYYLSCKRGIDICLAALLLTLCLPIFVVAAVLIRVDSPGPIFFRQERVGRDGKPFGIVKFRSMHRDAEERIQALQGLNEADGPLFKMRRDPRVTRVGRVLRRFSVDELPQLLNVLAGQMSLVGPRPPLPREVARYAPWQRRRLEVQPGITGLWQVSGRSDLPFDIGVQLDLAYIERCSLLIDLQILLRTVYVVLVSRGAY